MGTPPLPTAPNFNPDSFGRLATDRYDFEKHLDGYAGYHHVAPHIDLSPSITVNGTPTSTVQACLQAINALVPQVIPNATLGATGLIQLSGDLGGLSSSATNPKVGGLQGRPVSTLTPNTNDVLTWNGSVWIPTTTSSSPTLSSLTVSGATNLQSLTVNDGLTLTGSGTSSLASTGGSINITANNNIVETAQNLTINASVGTTITTPFVNVFGFLSSTNGLISFGDTTLGDISFSKNLTINAHTKVNNDVNFYSTIIARNTISFVDIGRVLYNGIVLPNSNTTVDIRQYKYIIIPNSNTAIRTYTISTSGLVDGDWVWIKNMSTTYNAIFNGAISVNFQPTWPNNWGKFVRISGTFYNVT